MSGHQLLSNKVFNLLNVGHNFKSLLTTNYANEQEVNWQKLQMKMQ
jgi:hypothetical protein